MRKFIFSLGVLAFAFIMPIAIQAQAQTAGTLTGTVTDEAGAVVPGANVEIKNTANGATRTTNANDNGVFNFTDVQPGTYTVTVENAGFKKAIANNISVEVTKPAQVSIALEAGQVTETVTVNGAQDVINTTSPTLTNVINTRQVQDLPLASRNPMDLAGLQAGIAVTGTATRTASVGGLRGSATNVTQDGINAMDNFVKTDSFFALTAPSLNSVDEFSITTGTTGPEAGRGVAQANFVTKAGTNDFHGTVFYQMINSALQSNAFFNNLNGIPRPDQHQHFYGFTIGGPVYFPAFGEGKPAIWNGHDKAFFFFSYEGFREHFQATRNRTVMTDSAKTGLFKYNTSSGVQTVNLLALGNFHTLNPLTLAQLSQMPSPNNTLVGDGLNTAGFSFNVVGSDPSDKYVARYDQTLVEHSRFGGHKLEFVYNRAHFVLFPDTFNAIEAPFPGGTNAGQASVRSLFTGAVHSTFGSNMTNTVRYGRQWSPVSFLREASPSAPFLTLASVTNFDNTFMSQGRTTTVNQIIDDFSWNHGSHLIRFGGDWQKVFADTFNDAGINKTITLGQNSANSTGLSIGQFPGGVNADVTRANAVYSDLVGLLGSASATFNVSSPTSGFVPGFTRKRLFEEKDLAAYVQDQWRAKSNLTLDFGVRWEFDGVPTIPNGLAIQVTNFNDVFGVSGPGNLFNPNAPVGAPPAKATLDFVSGDTGKKLFNNDSNNFAPFFGFAYSPQFKSGIMHAIFGSPGRSSIRGGYSISYLHDGFTVISNALGTGTTNPGLIQNAANTTPTGVLSAAGVPLVTPTFTIPITDLQNFTINSGNGLWAIDPNLRTPYVQQWNVGYEREIFKDTALEVRYVGNHAIKVWRATDINEVNIFENGFLNEFLGAQTNLAAYRAAHPNCSSNVAGNGFPCQFGNVGLPGQVSLPNIARLFTGFSATSSSGFGSTTFIGNLDNSNVGTFASTLAFSNTYKLNRALLPQNFFVANPNAAFARILTNDSMSNYHSLQVEMRRRFSRGIQFQANYTFSKSLTDATDAAGSQSDLVSFRTLRDKGLDYRRSNQDQTHRFVANAVYELPFGHGRSWFSGANGVVNQIIGNWNVGTIVTWQNRPPWFVASNRTTFNSFNAGNNPIDLVGMSFDEFKKHVGVFNTRSGIFFIDPTLLCIRTTTNGSTCAPDGGRFLSSTVKPGLFAVPAPGTFGNFPINSLNGPQYFNVDVSLTKRWPIGERVKLELKTTFINVLNHANFIYGTQSFDSSSFGLINSQSGNNRIIHFIGTLSF